MKRSTILSWLAAHGGQKDVSTKYVDVPNPKYGASSATGPGGLILPGQTGQTQPQTIKRKLVTWVSNDGQQIQAFDDTPSGEGVDPDKEFKPSDTQPGVEGPGVVNDPEYELFNGPSKADRDPNEPVQDPYQAAQSARALQESQANAAADDGKGRFETDAAKEARIRQEEDQQMQRDAAVRAEAQVLRQQGLDDRAAKAQAEANQLARDRLAQDATNSTASNEVARGNLAVSQAHLGLEQAAANKPQFLSTADPANKNIAAYNPVSGQIEVTANPNYDAIKAQAQQLQQELTLGIQLGNFDAQQAKTQYDQWYQQNVTVPFMAAQESRAQAADQRAAQQAEEQRNQFGAQFGLDKAKFGQTAGQNAAQNEIALLPYRVGGNFGPDMSSAINSLAAGGDVSGPSPSAGIHFSPNDFTYQAPNLQKIAEKATAAALSHLTNYKPGTTPFASAPAAALPGPGTFQSAPSGTSSIVDPGQLKNLYGQLIGPYQPPAAPAPAPAEAQPWPTQPSDQQQAAP